MGTPNRTKRIIVPIAHPFIDILTVLEVGMRLSPATNEITLYTNPEENGNELSIKVGSDWLDNDKQAQIKKLASWLGYSSNTATARELRIYREMVLTAIKLDYSKEDIRYEVFNYLKNLLNKGFINKKKYEKLHRIVDNSIKE